MTLACVASFAAVGTILGFAACTSFVMYPTDLQIVRRGYQLSPADIREIQRLPSVVGIAKPVAEIQAQSANEVSVICGTLYRRYVRTVYFVARRKDGHWYVDRSSIRESHDDDESVVVE